MTSRFRALALSCVLCLALPALTAEQPKGAVPKEKPKTFSDLLGGMTFRSIGPYRGGRVTAVAGVRGDRLTYYFGGSGGGVWKTSDGGSNWEPVSDKDFKTGSVGAIAVSESDPNVVYAGMGESPIRGNLSHGDGVWKSTDAGLSWRNVGLRDSRQIARVRVHPVHNEVVWVAAQGHPWAPNEERGVYRTQDGGATWKKVLGVDDRTGACDLALDPSNPRILYAAFWQVVRRPWELVSGGPGSSLYRTTDGGDTWKKLTEGLPEEAWGRVGVAASGARPGRVFAMVEAAKKGGLYVSDDSGEKWKQVNDEHKIRERAWYYSWVYPDPKNAEVVWLPNVQMHRSADGGRSFEKVSVPHGDNHDLWIDPDDPSRMILGNDGGATITPNGGRTWTTQGNQPTAQFYRVTTDDRFPYWVYGSQQDNSSVAIPSGVPGEAIDSSDWHSVGGGESGWIAPSPRNPDIVFGGEYGGQITRYDHRTRETRQIMAWPQLADGHATKELKYRFQWNAPIVISPHDPGILYHASHVLLRSTDEGETWEEASPDLTRNDPSKEGKSGGPISTDVTGVEVYDTIFALAPSKHEKGVIWAGSDDGLVHITRDDGKTWQNVTPAGIPAWIQINSLEVSPHDKATAYVAATMYKHDDFRPYLYRTNDYGKTWTKIVNGIPDGAFTRVVREDAARRGLLYAGTETGLFVSFDDGANWIPFQRNLPAVPITDMQVKNGDLVVATQGRAF
ncbi:MAG TPA: glycosyl hydrolase, partial [Thermoanaerobaculia bacterium]|nr:glycosyl hydrolase [Thermoanaerobaculia bacterium]